MWAVNAARSLRRPDFDDWTCLVVIIPLAVFAWFVGHHHVVQLDPTCGQGRYLAEFGRRPLGAAAVVVPALAAVAVTQVANRRLRTAAFLVIFLAEVALVLVPAFLPQDSGC